MAGWWYRASREERLAQIDAGIELGMTSAQVAMNCGCHQEQHRSSHGGHTVLSFARSHGRHFPRCTENTLRKIRENVGSVAPLFGDYRSRRSVRIDAATDAYLNGDSIDLWSVK